VLQVASSGSVQVQSGGSIQVESGANINVAAATGITFQAGISVGGTVGRWAFGTVGIAAGIGTIGIPGFTRVLSINANPVLGENQSSGSAAFVLTDLSLSASGSAILQLGSVGGALWNANGTVAWEAFGT
jgi:hypothetical protein